MHLYLFANEEHLDTSTKLIMCVLSCIKGPTAGAFAEEQIDIGIDKKDFGPWLAFKKTIEEQFVSLTLQKESEERIEKFYQGNMLVDNFIMHFNILRSQAGTSDAHTVYLLEKNTKSTIINQIYNDTSLPTTFIKWRDKIKGYGRMAETRECRKALIHGRKTEYCSGYNIYNGYSQKERGQNEDKRTTSGVTYRRKGQPMDLDMLKPNKSTDLDRLKPNFNSNGKPK